MIGSSSRRGRHRERGRSRHIHTMFTVYGMYVCIIIILKSSTPYTSYKNTETVQLDHGKILCVLFENAATSSFDDVNHNESEQRRLKTSS